MDDHKKRYVILNQNSLTGFLRGHFMGLHMLYYVGQWDHDPKQHKWSTSMRDAKIFDTEDEAWALLAKTWGTSQPCASVMSVHPNYRINEREPESNFP